jgi:hypothetical protein
MQPFCGNFLCFQKVFGIYGNLSDQMLSGISISLKHRSNAIVYAKSSAETRKYSGLCSEYISRILSLCRRKRFWTSFLGFSLWFWILSLSSFCYFMGFRNIFSEHLVIHFEEWPVRTFGNFILNCNTKVKRPKVKSKCKNRCFCGWWSELCGGWYHLVFFMFWKLNCYSAGKTGIPPDNFLKVTTFLWKCVAARSEVPITYLANHIGVAPKTARNGSILQWRILYPTR